LLLCGVGALAALSVAGCDPHHDCDDCDDDWGQPDTRAPQAPQGLWSITGDEEVLLLWQANSEWDLDGYRIYRNDEPTGYFERIASVGRGTRSYTDHDVTNGRTYWYAISAFDEARNEGELSRSVFDTPRPEGSGLRLANSRVQPRNSGYDFSEYDLVDWDDEDADIYYWHSEEEGAWMVATERSASEYCDIQDAGFVPLEDVDWAPEEGWAPRGEVPLIEGHSYLVWTWDNHYAKFRVASVTPERVIVEWAYQTDEGNPELLLPLRREVPARNPLGGLREHRAGPERRIGS